MGVELWDMVGGEMLFYGREKWFRAEAEVDGVWEPNNRSLAS